MKRDKSELYKSEIHNLIPGGAHTYSKGDDQFPENAPAAITHGKGAYVWDLDGNKFLDCSMGLTSVSLGHAYKSVVNEVKKELDKGVNFQRPSSLEREMALQFLSLIPQHDRIKFAKNGSTVTTAAVKLARAKTKRKLVAFPEDHPFYSYDDWFISSTPCNSGVPDEIKNLSITFKSCDLNSLEALFKKYPNQIACVITEPEKSFCSNCNCSISNEDFLKKAIQLTRKEGAIFILDEIVTGFKTYFPGTIIKYNLDPDLTTWGKGIANGFSFCALTGKNEIMDLGGIKQKEKERVFLISTTHGGETHALAACNATIEEFKKKKVIDHIQKTGNLLIETSKEIIKKHNLTEYVEVIPCWWQPLFIFKDTDNKVSSGLRTLMLQEMINRRILFQGIFSVSFSHKKREVELFCNALDSSLSIYKQALENGFEDLLIGDVIKPVFRKYN